MTAPLLAVSGLRKSYGDHEVLRGVDLHAEAGTVTALIGPSGSGKTTLLRSLDALEIPEVGRVRIGDAEVDYSAKPSRGELQALRAKSGMVFQTHHLFPHRTALENVIEGPVHAQKRPLAEAKEQAVELLGRVGLADKLDAYPASLSGGQAQRVGIARALALEPELLLFDEPTSALDPETVGDVLEVIRDLADQGWTMVIVTHEIAFARDVADRVLFLDGGRIVEEGSAREVLSRPKNERTRRFLSRDLDPLRTAELSASL